ncbi:tetraspanin-33-like [Ostrea edulis]|uniref:tetraspanin-33-like n=1 Tax=Ostrea edulis TaxID=37623 RepID=UPI0024AFE30F|nr:tetraspanin-33-like [Ostrea edulis]
MAKGRRRTAESRSGINPCLKHFIFLFNLIVLAGALVVVGLMSWILYEKEKKISSFSDVLLDPSLIFLIAGCIATIIAFLGALGSLREIDTILRIYSLVVTFFLFIQLVGIIFVFIFYYDVNVLVKIGIYPEDVFENVIKNYSEDPDDLDADIRDVIHGWQEDMQCCGFSNDDEGYKAWKNNLYFNCTAGNKSPLKCSVPWSCCVYKDGDTKNTKCGNGVLNSTSVSAVQLSSKINTRGCLKAFKEWIGSNIFIVTCGIIGAFVPQMMAINFADRLYNQIRTEESKWSTL